MDLLHNMTLGLYNIADLSILCILIIGSLIGIIIGAIPGLSATMAVGLSIPITFKMAAMPGLALLISVWIGALTGGLISAILLNIPGTPASICTTFDGYPMAQKTPGKALGYGITASLFGAGFSYIVLLTLAPVCAELALRLGNFEIFSLVMCAMVMIADSTEGDFIRAAIAGFLGMLISCVGIAPIDGTLRFTFDSLLLANGFDLTAMLLGLFAIPQLLTEVQIKNKKLPEFSLDFREVLPSFKELKESAGNILRSSFIGTWIGILPGAGTVTAGIVAYNQAKSSSAHPETFGKGEKQGIIASESANKAVSGGAMVPLLSLGIPGCPVAALVLSGMIMKDVQPGPALFASDPALIYGIFFAFIATDFIVFALMLGLLKPFAMVTKVKMCYLMPFILCMCVIGCFVINNSIDYVWVLIGFGLLGFFMQYAGFPVGSFVLGIILGPLAEINLREGLNNSFGDISPLWTRPISLAFLLLAVIVFVWPRYRAYKRKKRAA